MPPRWRRPCRPQRRPAERLVGAAPPGEPVIGRLAGPVQADHPPIRRKRGEQLKQVAAPQAGTQLGRPYPYSDSSRASTHPCTAVDIGNSSCRHCRANPAGQAGYGPPAVVALASWSKWPRGNFQAARQPAVSSARILQALTTAAESAVALSHRGCQRLTSPQLHQNRRLQIIWPAHLAR
jgi:hypothetical protein